MNGRIQELAKQAETLADEETKSLTDDSGQWQVIWNEVYDEKFAELIVRDCVNRIEQNRSSGENTDSWTITRDMAFHQMKEDLKRHFGVE